MFVELLGVLEMECGMLVVSPFRKILWNCCSVISEVGVLIFNDVFKLLILKYVHFLEQGIKALTWLTLEKIR